MPIKSTAPRLALFQLSCMLLTLACRPKPPAAEPIAQEGGASVTAPASSLQATPSAKSAAVSTITSAPSADPLEAPATASVTSPGSAARAHRLLIVGDSLSDPRVGGGGYLAKILAACPRSSSKNLARGGFMVNQMRRRFEAEALAELPGDFSELLVFGGVNDLYSDETAGRSVAKIQRDLSLLYAAGKSRGLRVIALTVAPWGGFSRYFTARRAETTRELNAWIRARRAAGEVDVVVDAYQILSCGDPERLCNRYTPPFDDGLHFGPQGHARLAEGLLAEAFPDCTPPASPPPLP